MNPSRVLIAGAVILAAFILAFSSGMTTSAENPSEAQTNLFDGKIVTAYIDDPLQGAGQVMKEVRLQKIGDRWILLGTAVSTGQAGEWDEGLAVGLSWEDVNAFYVFTPAQFAEKMTNPSF